MLELEKRMQEEPFDVEVQYCDPEDCEHDCLTSQVGDIYTDIQTPEIDYASITKYEDMLIAGVPALYRISNGKITEFYFDSVEIEEFFNSIGR